MTNYTTCNKKCITLLIYTLLLDGPPLYPSSLLSTADNWQEEIALPIYLHCDILHAAYNQTHAKMTKYCCTQPCNCVWCIFCNYTDYVSLTSRLSNNSPLHL